MFIAFTLLSKGKEVKYCFKKIQGEVASGLKALRCFCIRGKRRCSVAEIH
jgi:hypothetical protein